MIGLFINQVIKITFFYTLARTSSGWILVLPIVVVLGDLIHRYSIRSNLGRISLVLLILLSLVSNVALWLAFLGYSDFNDPVLMQNLKNGIAINDPISTREFAQQQNAITYGLLVAGICEALTWVLFLWKKGNARARLTP